MVVVGMGPARRIDLTGRNAHGAEGSHQEGGLLAATSPRCAHGSQRRTGTDVGGGIVDLLVAPVVHFEHGIVQVESLDTGQQFFLEHHARTVEVLVVDTDGQHKVTEHIVGHLPRHLATYLQRSPDIGEEEFALIVGHIVGRHVGVEKLHGLALGRGHGGVEDIKQMAVRQGRLLDTEIFFQLCLVVSTLLCTHGSTGQGEQAQQEQY